MLKVLIDILVGIGGVVVVVILMMLAAAIIVGKYAGWGE